LHLTLTGFDCLRNENHCAFVDRQDL
jgi:hypothetical protein